MKLTKELRDKILKIIKESLTEVYDIKTSSPKQQEFFNKCEEKLKSLSSEKEIESSSKTPPIPGQGETTS